MSIRTTEPGTAGAEEPERERPGAGSRSAVPLEPTNAAVADAAPPADLPEDREPGGAEPSGDAEPRRDLVAVPPEDLAPTAPAPGQGLAPAAPVPGQDLGEAATERSTDPVRAASIEPASSLDPAHDAALATSAGGAGSGSGSRGGAAAGKGRGRRPKKDPEGRMALREHLTELRKRIVRAGIFVLLGAIAGWFLYDPVINYMTQPLQELRAEDGTRLISINFNNVGASFDLKLKGAVWIGFIVSSPFWIYQLWAFITPGLTKKERRYAVGFVSAAVPLFLAGVYLASLFIPRAVAFLTSFTPDGASNLTDAPSYIAFILRTVLTFGLAFLLPVVLVGLNFAGLLSGKAILKAWRWVLVACFTFAAIATPTPDVIAMFTLAAPIIFLFFAAIVVCLLHDRRKAKREPSYAGLDDDRASTLGDDEASPL